MGAAGASAGSVQHSKAAAAAARPLNARHGAAPLKTAGSRQGAPELVVRCGQGRKRRQLVRQAAEQRKRSSCNARVAPKHLRCITLALHAPAPPAGGRRRRWGPPESPGCRPASRRGRRGRPSCRREARSRPALRPAGGEQAGRVRCRQGPQSSSGRWALEPASRERAAGSKQAQPQQAQPPQGSSCTALPDTQWAGGRARR